MDSDRLGKHAYESRKGVNLDNRLADCHHYRSGVMSKAPIAIVMPPNIFASSTVSMPCPTNIAVTFATLWLQERRLRTSAQNQEYGHDRIVDENGRLELSYESPEHEIEYECEDHCAYGGAKPARDNFQKASGIQGVL